eukprot:CAMPEP_0173216268 /NCGR_PEP_ID=MMETSP1141-20130122/26923_1 /TAXON_ID=483371 /ORGANISM="non described non described, Strain CCMP2298" /LENGTH=87 /DNA_ID=CAMNT_0014143703 /DNA_START=69 /DNA_END=332 /DNA_ORIENTATION=+
MSSTSSTDPCCTRPTSAEQTEAQARTMQEESASRPTRQSVRRPATEPSPPLQLLLLLLPPPPPRTVLVLGAWQARHTASPQLLQHHI